MSCSSIKNYLFERYNEVTTFFPRMKIELSSHLMIQTCLY